MYIVYFLYVNIECIRFVYIRLYIRYKRYVKAQKQKVRMGEIASGVGKSLFFGVKFYIILVLEIVGVIRLVYKNGFWVFKGRENQDFLVFNQDFLVFSYKGMKMVKSYFWLLGEYYGFG